MRRMFLETPYAVVVLGIGGPLVGLAVGVSGWGVAAIGIGAIVVTLIIAAVELKLGILEPRDWGQRLKARR